MKGIYGGPIPVGQLFQALLLDREFFRRHGITHVRDANFYFTPCDAAGKPVAICGETGAPVEGYQSAGGYPSAADDYDLRRAEHTTLEPVTLCRQA